VRSRSLFTPRQFPVVLSPRDETTVITSVEEWLLYAGPLGGEKQWADFRSAKEVAKAWCRGGGVTDVPPELQVLLNSNEVFGPLTVCTAIPELPTSFGDVPRGRRRHDMVLFCLDRHEAKVLVGLEAKADEPFDQSITARIRKARSRTARLAEQGKRDNSALIARIVWFCRALFGRDGVALGGAVDPELAALPYQLLAGAAGTLIEAAARGAERAGFVVHAFHSHGLDLEKLSLNDADFARFVAALPRSVSVAVEYGQLLGPFHPPGSGRIPALPLTVGITARRLDD
jgi:hypothetical protein